MVMGSNKNNSSRHVPPPLAGADNFPREIHEDIEKMRNILVWLQDMSALINLPPRVLPDPKIPSQHQLQFQNKVQNPSFTTNLVSDDNGSPIKVAIYDTSTQSIISADNFLSSAKVRIIVLDAEFWKNRVHWSRGEFDQNLLGGREGKGPILTGRSRIIQLENGVGTFENIVFNDNSSWTKSGFRLGVMVVSDGEEGYFNGERVQEGVSEPFRVKDRRMKASQKPDRLKLTHKVQSLKKVGKDRASLLQKKNINTVEDFLKFYYNDEAALRELLCIKSESGKEWDSMVEHATQCANEFHAKYNALNNSSQPRQALVHPIEGNISLFTNGGSSVVSSGSSEPNPSKNDITEGDVPAFNRQNVGVVCIPEINLSNKVETQKYLTFIPNDGDAESSPDYNTQVSSRGGFMSSANRKNYMRPPYSRFRSRITLKHEFSVWS